jgi:pseudouridine kinase
MGIVVIGASFVDIKGFPLGLYIPDGRNVGRVEYIHGGVARNVVEDIANVELRPTYVGIVDDTPMGDAVVKKLKNHKVNTDYVLTIPDGMGTWLAVFDNHGDVAGSLSKRPNMLPIVDLLEEKGDEIFAAADSVVLEIDMEVPLVKQIFALAEKHHKDVYAVVSNMSIAVERRDLLKKTGCVVCNLQEAGMLFSENYEELTPEELCPILARRIESAQIRRMIVTMGGQGAVYAEQDGPSGLCPPQKVDVIDTTGAGDGFFSGVAIGLTYGKSLEEACRIGTRLAASVISTRESVCPRFLPQEFDLELPETL